MILNSRVIGMPPAHVRTIADRLIVHPPGVQPRQWRFENLLAIPQLGGLYDLSGRRVDQARPYGAIDDDLLSTKERIKFHAKTLDIWHPEVIDVPALRAEHGAFDEVAEPALFLGGYGQHYGHWLTDFTSRLWATDCPDRPARRMLPLTRKRPAWNLPYVRPFFDAAGLDEAGTGHLERPVIFRDVGIPEPAFILQRQIHDCADQIHLRIAETLLPQARKRFDGKRVYLSRSNLIGGIRTVEAEAEVEALFADPGFLIVYPEQMDFAEQIGLFNSAAVIAALSGSALHTGMFSRRDFRGTVIVVCGDEGINSRLVLQAAIKNYDSVFVRGYTYVAGAGKAEKPRIVPDLAALEANLRGFFTAV